ncbi:MAG: discoidin domain-containing protein [Armatimonadota bacterium]
MHKTRFIVLLAIVCVFVMSIPVFAQLPTAGWPKYQHDAYNSGRSSATVIAKPYTEWSTAAGFAITRAGLVLDSSGNVYAMSQYNNPLVKITSGGTVDTGFTWTAGSTTASSANRNGPLLFDDGTSQYVVIGPGRSAADATMGHTFAGYMSNGSSAWSSDLYSTFPGSIGNSYTSPAVGEDGTIYTHGQQWTYSDDGPIVALNANGTTKWTFNAPSASGMNSLGFGGINGALAVQRIPASGGVAAHNRIFISGGNHFDSYDLAYRSARHKYQVIAIDDMGTYAELVWGAYNPCYSYGPPSISNDGNTVYVTGGNSWEYCDGHSPIAYTYNTLVAYDAETGGNRSTFSNQRCPGDGVVTDGRADGSYWAGDANIPDNSGEVDWITNYKDTGGPKWKLDTGTESVFPPAIGADGTLYVASSFIYSQLTSKLGRVVAVTDNGDHGTIKWALDLPDDGSSECSNIAVTNTNPAVLYVGTGNGRLSGGRIYAIKDMGTYGKILWTYQDINEGAAGKWPLYLALDDSGNLYAAINNLVRKFPAGFDVNNPNGISGYVKDSAGNPINDAWVSVSTSGTLYPPAGGDKQRIRTRTDADGYYQMGIAAAGTYYVAATAPSYKGTTLSGSLRAIYTATNLSNVNKFNLTLVPAGFNWAWGANATCSNADASYPASNAVDNDLNTQFRATSLPASLVIDLGSAKTINEAAFYWGSDFASAYTVQYSNDQVTWTTANAYTVATGNGGYPLDWNVSTTNPGNTGAPYMKTGYNVLKLNAATARYWQINVTASALATTGAAATDVWLWDVELRDSTLAAQPATIAGARNTPDGAPAKFDNAVVTNVVDANTLFVESANRTAGIRVNKTGGTAGIYFGDKVSVNGVVGSSNGEKYIAATTLTRTTTTQSPDGPAIAELSMNNKSAGDSVSQGLFIKTWGKVSDSTPGSFVISDGSASPIKVIYDSSASFALPVDNDYIRVRGVVGKDADGTVLYMRSERADWAYDSDNMHALPFTGQYDYPIQSLVLGPFTDANKTMAELYAWDPIVETTIGDSVKPVAGLETAGKTWFVGTSKDGILDLNAAFGGDDTESGAISKSVAYVFLYVWSESATTLDATALATGSDDCLKVYVNQSIVSGASYYSDAGRGVDIGQEKGTITLNQGLNSILLKVVNGSSGFAVSSQIVPADFEGYNGYGCYGPYTATGLGYSLNPATP